KEAHRALQEYTTLRFQNANTAEERFASEFVLKLLKKRLFSSPAAFQTTLEKHISSAGGRKALVGWQKDVSEYSDDYADDEHYESDTGEAMGTASQVLSPLAPE